MPRIVVAKETRINVRSYFLVSIYTNTTRLLLWFRILLLVLIFVSALYCFYSMFYNSKRRQGWSMWPDRFPKFDSTHRVHIVTSTYKDEFKLKWTQKLPTGVSYTIYKKNDHLLVGQENRIADHVVEIPNVGRCDYAFLYHIVKNYDTLDDITVFVKCNWQDNTIPFWKLVDECRGYDYMTVGTHFETFDWDTALRQRETRHAESSIDWYTHIFTNAPATPGKVNRWGHGPCFSVSRDLIRRHPKSTYEYLLQRFYPESKSFDALHYLAHGYATYSDMIKDVGIIYHNELLRFYTVLFTHNISDTFRIYRDPGLTRV